MDKNLKILLVDDDEHVRGLWRDILLMSNICAPENILIALDGVEGLDLFHSGQPQIVVSDIIMPRMNGEEMIKRIRETGSDVEIVVMTGYADFDMLNSLFNYNIVDFIKKPFKPKEFELTMVRIIDRIKLKNQNADYKRRLLQADRFSSVGVIASDVVREIGKLNDDIQKKLPDEILPLSIKQSSDGIQVLVSSLISFVNQASADPRPVEIVSLLNEAFILTCQHEQSRYIELKHPEQLSCVLVDSQMIIQVFVNVIVNILFVMQSQSNDEISPLLIQIKEDGSMGKQYVTFNHAVLSRLPFETAINLFDPLFIVRKKEEKLNESDFVIAKERMEQGGGIIQLRMNENKDLEINIELSLA